MQREKCNETISYQDTKAKGGEIGQRRSRDNYSC